jgi:Zn-dependent peptidase ImmA (M78 family)
MEALKVGPKNRRPMAIVAASLRRRADQVEPAYSTMQIVEACFPGTVVTGRRLPPGFKDVVRVDDKAFRTHRAPHVIVYNRALSSAEQRHAIAHAVAHVIFDGARHEGCSPHDRARELRCDRFADELLAPISELHPYVCAWPSSDSEKHETYLDQVDLIASHFHVPAAVVERQISRLRRRHVA